MKAFELRGFGLESLVLTERPEPVPGPFETVVRMRAASLNYRDLVLIQGTYDPKLRLPLVPLSDGAGEVVAVGPGVTRVKPGDRVVLSYVQDWVTGEPEPSLVTRRLGGPLDGVLAEYVKVPEHGLVRAPAHLSDVEAATLPIAAVTAWHALFEVGRVRPGDTVLVEGTGGVSLFALQLARLAGARVLVTSGSDEKLARAKALGASAGINYRKTPEWDEAVLSLTGGRGVDHVVEVAGGPNLSRALRAVRMGGEVTVVGFLEEMRAELELLQAIRRHVTVRAVSVGSRASFEHLVRALEVHEVHPVVDRVFPFADARAALGYLASGQHFGKVALAFPR
ncbi:NAD(P)-dependent alcohol dehydrogenase [Vitiosangium sp. GDMCC 1.1324]|uniref:zinc-dependent alcohol dehydrogenase family protein n=1 Tax=Vitiosangium sp. (strain GDMCC 1.1324) TaxID=2138576 RepID=UPI000D39BFFC|nr:NAD(P)-dependent alcohol dehydrogenase [Vitiosangium sp. GDMCC 1.1324]PTL84149.1 NAD(P)-dependent alcohol dehydrogenase [Vitiosangium sp. GDMCC 1.1324]